MGIRHYGAGMVMLLGVVLLSAPRGFALELTSPDFAQQGAIPVRFTCEGANVNPELDIRDVPAGTRSLALIVEDPDAPGKIWIHWVVFNIAPETRRIAVNSTPGVQGTNDFGQVGYGGPCPPSGTHRYYFQVYALNTRLDLPGGVSKEDLVEAMKGHILAEAKLVGLYHKSGHQWGF